MYYWRKNNGTKIDCIIDYGNQISAIEIKGGQTFSQDYLKNLSAFSKYTIVNNIDKYVV
jgi:hypothetical protein